MYTEAGAKQLTIFPKSQLCVVGLVIFEKSFGVDSNFSVKLRFIQNVTEKKQRQKYFIFNEQSTVLLFNFV